MNTVTNDRNTDKISWLTRISYGLGDTAQNVVWGAMSILTFFHTDYAGVDPSIVGLVMLLSRCFDGFSDVAMGFVVERTHSKWGKARPWILWGSIPFAISIVLLYTVPQGSAALQFAYIFVTYNFCTTVCYTMMNLPYGSLSALMTAISRERDMLSITRMTLSPIGKILAVSATLPLVKIFGDTQLAWVKVMSIWAIVALMLLLLCFYQCKEKVTFCPWLLKRFGKRNMSLYGIILAFVGHLVYLIEPYNFYMVLFSSFIRGLCFAPLNAVIFGFFGDVVDYSQWKFNVRQEGLIFSGGSVGNKIGGGIVSALLTGLLTYSGYISSAVAGVAQPDSAINMIVNIYKFDPLVIWGIVIIILYLYKLDKEYPKIIHDLIEREARSQ